jgi:tripartite-type tricarboxylate transporter receptor subunit TctC
MQRRTLIQAAAGATTMLALPALRAQTAQGTQNLPTGAVRIIVGFPPGGGTDALARIMAAKLTPMWGQQVIVETKAGVAGVLAADYTVTQPADGTTLLMAHINSHALAPSLQPNLKYDPVADFTPIALVGVTPNLWVCNPSQPEKTVPEIVALCKARPGEISFGSAGSGSAQHLALELFKLRAGINVIHVPYKGSAPAITDLIGGQIQYAFETMTAATPHVKGGRLIAIAQTRAKRAKSYPNVPTMVELGYPGFEATTWYGLVGPARLPAAMAQRMNEDVNKVLAMPDVQASLEQYGAEDGGGSRERFAEFIKSEIAQWRKVVKDGNVKSDT